MAIEFSREVRAKLVESLQRYFSEKLETSIGNMDAEFLLEFFVMEIGPRIYNQAIRDAQVVVQERLMELEAICFEAEEGYWESAARRESRLKAR